MPMPYFIEQTPNGERTYDIYTRMLKERIIFIDGAIGEQVLASQIVSQLLLLESENPGKDITLYINSPGGSISEGMAIYDTMQYITSDVRTVCMGLAASMGAFLLGAGTKGKRHVLPNAEVMIHQPLGGARGQASDIEITARHILKLKKRLYTLQAEQWGHTFAEIEEACDRDNWLTAEEAVAFGVADSIMEKPKLP